jgi:hypothetical protein
MMLRARFESRSFSAPATMPSAILTQRTLWFSQVACVPELLELNRYSARESIMVCSGLPSAFYSSLRNSTERAAWTAAFVDRAAIQGELLRLSLLGFLRIYTSAVRLLLETRRRCRLRSAIYGRGRIAADWRPWPM